MDIQQFYQDAVQAARDLADDDDQRQRTMDFELSNRLTIVNSTREYEIERTRSPDADAFVLRNQDACRQLLRGLIHSIQTMDQAIGHDRIHLAFDLFEGARALAEDELAPCEEFIVLLGVICHDIGRYAEEKAFGKPMATQVHAWFSVYILDRIRFEMIRSADEKDASFWNMIWARATGCVAAHFGANDTSDPLRHYVQSVDRLAGIFGIRDFARNLACDMYLRGARFWPDPMLNGAWGMAPFNNLPPENFEGATRIQNSWTNVIHYLEVPIRTSYPLATVLMQARADDMKIQAARLLMLLGGGIPRDQRIPTGEQTLAMRIFAPELVEYVGIPVDHFGLPPKTEGLTRWDKWGKKLPQSAWDTVWEEYPENVDALPDWPYIPPEIRTPMFHLIDSAWRGGHEFTFHPRDLIASFLHDQAYTLAPAIRSVLARKIIDETAVAFPEDGDSMLAFGFGFALAEARVRSREEQTELHRLQGLTDAPLLSAVASAIAEEPIFRIHGMQIEI